MEWELWGFIGVGGLDMRICWGFREKKMRGALHSGFAFGRDDGGGGWVGADENRQQQGQRRNAGVPPLRFASVGMTVSVICALRSG